MAKLTKGIIFHLNRTLKDLGVGFYYELSDLDTYAPRAQIKVIDPCEFVDSSIVNCTDIYYKWLEDWFKHNYDIEICYNNTRTIIWSNDYS